MSNLFKLILVYLISIIFGIVIFVLCFSTSIFRSIDVFFYRGIALLILTVIFVAIALCAVKKYILKNLLSVKDILLCLCIIFSVSLLFFTHVPVTAERSISIFTLAYMEDNSDRIITEEEMKNYFIEQYVNNYGAFQKRFHEQIVTGTIKPVEDGYQITKRGIWLMKFYDLIADVFKIDKKLISSTE